MFNTHLLKLPLSQTSFDGPKGVRAIEVLLYLFLQDLRNSLPALLENIFGFGSEPGWGLDVISKSQNPHEYEAVLRLLDPEGPLLSFIYSLQTDIYLTYEFPFSCLPVSSAQDSWGTV